MKTDLDIIKKLYGEKMSHLCRFLFPTILETPGKLSTIIKEKFYPTRFLYEDLVNSNNIETFKNYIFESLQHTKKRIDTNKTVEELLASVGYKIYECHTEDEIQSFKKYYTEQEELCTFNKGRLNTHHVFFIVKDNALNLKREDFISPSREDEYSTSILSIQFRRGTTNDVSIISRYNHTVINPNATYSNNLDRIVPGLAAAFEACYNFNINEAYDTNIEMPNYVCLNNKFYRYNYEINAIYYCPNNLIICGKDQILDKSRYLVFDYFILDMQEKKVRLFDGLIEDSFPNQLDNISKIEINNLEEGKEIIIKRINKEDVIITLDKYNRIISYIDNNLTISGRCFLQHNELLNYIECNNLKHIDSSFLRNNLALKEISLPKVKEIKDYFLFNNLYLKNIYAPNLRIINNAFLFNNSSLEELNLPLTTYIGDDFLSNNRIIDSINMPNVEIIGTNFLRNNTSLIKLSLPSLEEVGNSFLYQNTTLKKIDCRNLKTIGNSFLFHNKELETINLPQILIIGSDFLYWNDKILFVSFKRLKSVNSNFMLFNNSSTINLPSLKKVGDNFLYRNTNAKEINIPNLKYIGNNFFYSHPNIVLNNTSYTLKIKLYLHKLRESIYKKQEPEKRI